MASLSSLPTRRRSHSAVEHSDEEFQAEEISNEYSPVGTKRSRLNGSPEGSAGSSDSNIELPNHRSRERDNISGGYETIQNGQRSTSSRFQPGAIIRVKLTNFVTYDKAEFHPGPNLNMVIGPNGTGKSSLVCAICLGLGWGPSILGRAAQVGEFVKHGMDDASVEIELQGREHDVENYTIRLRIVRETNTREWWLNGKKSIYRTIQTLVKSLSIQIDNLCQFLPQDKVSEFAGLSPVELLQQTLRAAAPQQMIDWHEDLKRHRKEQKALNTQQEADKEILLNMETRQQNLQDEVQRLKERVGIKKRIKRLENSLPFVNYNLKQREQVELKKQRKAARIRLKELEARVQPTLQAVNSKEAYERRIKTVVGERKQRLKQIEYEADKLKAKIESLDDKIKANEQKVIVERNGDASRRKEVQKIQRKISELKARLNEAPLPFDSVAWNERIRAREFDLRKVKSKTEDLQAQDTDLKTKAAEILEKKRTAEQELAAFDTREGQQLGKLERASIETAKAWKWVQEHQDEFEKEIFAPALLSCSIKDKKYADSIESILSFNDFRAITVQTREDYQKLSEMLQGTMGLADIALRTSTEILSEKPVPPISRERLHQLGFDGWAIDFLEGPEPVLAMLCDHARLNVTAIALREFNDNQHTTVTQDGALNNWIAGKFHYKIIRRREYGPQATSTSTAAVRPARHWTDQPIDAAAKRQVDARILNLTTDFEKLKSAVKPVREELAKLRPEINAIESDITQLKKDKAEEQLAHGKQVALPNEIARTEESLQGFLNKGNEYRARLKELREIHDDLIIQKATGSFRYKDQVSIIRTAHEELLEAEIRHLEAANDAKVLMERNAGILRGVEQERQKADDADKQTKAASEAAHEILGECRGILMAEPQDADYFQSVARDAGITVESVNNDVAAEKSKLQYTHEGNPNALRDFEKRQKTLENLKGKMDETRASLEQLSSDIESIQREWEPQLDEIVSKIDEAFSANFEQIGCAGEVGVHKDDDFELWAIRIKVKFRETETLQQLDQHRQSGGERSVSTIFYLMSLQSLARAPFRVVDEINQGMDPRNERMVHERMVTIACQEHTSQYFLITPKLLTGLKYDLNMTVMCIASGEHMLDDYRQVDINRVIEKRRAVMAGV